MLSSCLSVGNVELWSPCMLPIGTVWLQQPRLYFAARRLGVDYAHAMTGFERADGKFAPWLLLVCSYPVQIHLDEHSLSSNPTGALSRPVCTDQKWNCRLH